MDAVNRPQDYYIASALTQQNIDAFGGVHTKAGVPVWLSWSREGGGWPQCSRDKRDAQHFHSVEEIKKNAKNYNGMPWFYRFDPKTLRIFKIEHRPVQRTVYEPYEVEIK